MTAPLRIACAAVRLQLPADLGAVKAGDWLMVSMPSPARHHHLLHALATLGLHEREVEQAFLLSDGTWADRKRALEIATAAGQLVKNPDAASSPIAPPNLFSEDLW